MPNRVQFSSTNNSVATMTLPINPVAVDLGMGIDWETLETLDGEPISSMPFFDGRIRSLTWRNIPNKTPYSEMVSGLRSLIYLVSGCQMNLKDLHENVGNNVWIPVKVITVDTVWAEGAGPSTAKNNLQWSTIELKFSYRYQGI